MDPRTPNNEEKNLIEEFMRSNPGMIASQDSDDGKIKLIIFIDRNEYDPEFGMSDGVAGALQEIIERDRKTYAKAIINRIESTLPEPIKAAAKSAYKDAFGEDYVPESNAEGVEYTEHERQKIDEFLSSMMNDTSDQE